MKNIVNRIVISAVLIMSTPAVFAQAESAGLKIAVLDMAAALLNSDMAKEVDAELNAETKEDQDKIRNISQQAQTLNDQLQKDRAVLSDAEQRRIVGEIQELQNQYQFLVQKLQTLSNERRQQLQETYAPNLVEAISQVMEEEGYDIVLRGQAAVYFRPTLDITAKVTEKLNQQQ